MPAATSRRSQPLRMRSGLMAQVDFARIPCMPEAVQIAQSGTATGASPRNWSGYGHEVLLPAGFADWQRNLLTDPQTSGGLLIACAPEAVDEVMAILQAQGFDQATVFGQLQSGPAQLHLV